MTDAHDATPVAELDRLTDVERNILILLAKGHTAKTIASETGLSVAAVNERLRAARRRTGAGSSRELARLLAQENRDDFSGVGAAAEAASSSAGQPTFRWLTRRNVMIASAALAAVLAIAVGPQLIDPQTSPAVGSNADVIERLSTPSTPQQLRGQLNAEGRDVAWADATEVGIREAYGARPNFARTVDRLSVACGRTLCEVIGRTRNGAPGDDVTQVLIDVQSPQAVEAIAALGLEGRSSSFTADPADPQGMVFVTYFARGG